MSAFVQIRNVPDEVHSALRERAAARGQSLNAYLLDVLQHDVAWPQVEMVLDRAYARHGRASASATELVRRDRDDRSSRG